MMRKILLILFSMISMVVVYAESDPEPTPNIKNEIQKIKEKQNEPFDTTRDNNYWKRALKHGKLNVYDKSVVYPSFLEFCLDVYRWGDHAFNYYDTTYVVGTGKNWKLMLKNNNWMDSYAGHLGYDRVPLSIRSNLTSTFGFNIAFMAVSLGYMFNVNDLISGSKVKNTRWEFSFTCSRIAFDAYYYKNKSDVNLHRLGDFSTSLFKPYKFGGFTRTAYGLYAYYFFNHKHYAQAASYCFSKYQKKSAGSFIAGLHASHQDVDMDFSSLPDDIKYYLFDDKTDYRFRYRDYSFILGYGYNWVLGKHWLFNMTLTPGVGYRHTFPNSIEGAKNMCSFIYRAKMGLVLNRNRFFYGLHIFTNGTWYVSREYSFFNANHDLNVTAGFRF